MTTCHDMQNDVDTQVRPTKPASFLACEAEKSVPSPAEPSVDFPVSVVLPAGGTGERTGLQTPKQFCYLLGRPLISYAIQAFERLPWVQNIVVVVAKENMEPMTDIVQRFQHRKVRAVPGGSTRHRSIYEGLCSLDWEPTERPKVVIIHDAVRPFVEEELVRKIAVEADKHGAAGAIRPLVSTVIATTPDSFLDHSLERAKYRASEMPQGFKYDAILQAYQRCTEFDLEFGTECLHLALQYCGINARLIEGPPALWKVTYKRDLAAAESIVKDSLSRSACIITDGSSQATTLAEELQKAVATMEMKLDIILDLDGNLGRCPVQEWNFIQVSINRSDLAAVRPICAALEASDRALLHPLVVVWVCLSTAVEPSVTVPEPEAFMDLASTAKLRNVFLYGIQLRLCTDSARWQRALSKLAEMTSTLIRDRSPVLVGQVLRA
ncbi:D-ribitol-5-phosphate cytidylyltransferase isoform X2 [Synchiropus splendidus]|uniref:D-ribitol-5-phosphate cytidylyltransferase isoform X2 n=1 Tax=Synchiropus splendidus TaxID=270530 RepID=UPI00237E98DA|nr:D-ribitol-5-phosphate cytidylyltransferase isoform X2 [Synchiropus splendidus]